MGKFASLMCRLDARLAGEDVDGLSEADAAEDLLAEREEITPALAAEAMPEGRVRADTERRTDVVVVGEWAAGPETGPALGERGHAHSLDVGDQVDPLPDPIQIVPRRWPLWGHRV